MRFIQHHRKDTVKSYDFSVKTVTNLNKHTFIYLKREKIRREEKKDDHRIK